MSKVIITTGGHTIELEQDGVSAKELSKLAHRLWQQTRDPKLDAWSNLGFTFATERNVQLGEHDAAR
jgi:hypothetical protein